MNRHKFTSNISYLGGGWLSIEGIKRVALDEGASVGDPTGITLDECKEECDTNFKCHSFAYGSKTSVCHLKDQCITCIEDKCTKEVAGFITYYKVCGKMVNIF